MKNKISCYFDWNNAALTSVALCYEQARLNLILILSACNDTYTILIIQISVVFNKIFSELFYILWTQSKSIWSLKAT